MKLEDTRRKDEDSYKLRPEDSCTMTTPLLVPQLKTTRLGYHKIEQTTEMQSAVRSPSRRLNTMKPQRASAATANDEPQIQENKNARRRCQAP